MSSSVQLIKVLIAAGISIGSINAPAEAAPTPTINMTITPLLCDVEVIHDGMQSKVYVDSVNCHKALVKVYPSLEAAATQ